MILLRCSFSNHCPRKSWGGGLDGFLQLTDLTLRFTGIAHSGGSITAGSVSVEASSAVLFPGQPFSASVSDGADVDDPALAISGTYNPATEVFSLAIDQLDLNIGSSFRLQAEGVSFDVDSVAGTFSVSGTAVIDAFGVVLGTATFNITQGTTTLTDTNTAPLSVTGDLLLVQLTQTDLFVGTGASIDTKGTATLVDDRLDVTGATGFHVSGASLNLATLTDSGTTYTGLELILDEVGLDGVTDLTLTVASGSVLFNEVSVGTTKLDWATTTSDNNCCRRKRSATS